MSSVLRDMSSIRKTRNRSSNLSLTRELQQHYYQAKAALSGFDIAAAAYPANSTGGDYFDFIPQRDGSLYIVMADIMGPSTRIRFDDGRGGGGVCAGVFGHDVKYHVCSRERPLLTQKHC